MMILSEFCVHFVLLLNLNFNVDESILKAAEELRDRLEIVSQERKTDEFFENIKITKAFSWIKTSTNYQSDGSYLS
ncbi:MAG: hypothetical protein MZV64_32415 [Ignavibacteriales bacterium]|nr:hypothetical protein [Ignavibacteriales bacterium]